MCLEDLLRFIASAQKTRRYFQPLFNVSTDEFLSKNGIAFVHFGAYFE